MAAGRAFVCAAVALLAAGGAFVSRAARGKGRNSSAGEVPEYRVQVIETYPHDRSAFTQGLEYRGGFLYEGTGLNGHSSLRQVELKTGRVVKEISLAAQYFGEGITVINGRIVQLTWKSHTGFVYEQPTFRLLKQFDYPGEGWGLTNNGKYIYMSDGTAQIRYWDPYTLSELRRVTVHDGSHDIDNLNELEYVNGEVYANVWGTDRIARISPQDGRVVGWIDASGLLSAEDVQSAPVDVLNGIAYDAMGDRLFLTGKLWPKLFQVKVVLKRGPASKE